ncbi:MAG: flagellar basal body rod C-terminal domain-containing protein [Nitrospirota bacterium]
MTALRESVSGVSLDEELTNLLSFQRSFEASARMITVADELMQTMLAMGR